MNYAWNQPTTSTTKFTEPITGASFEFHNDTLPSAPTFATTEFATGTTGKKFNDDATGRTSPFGHTVTYPADSAPVAVTNTPHPHHEPGTPRDPHDTSTPTRRQLRQRERVHQPRRHNDVNEEPARTNDDVDGQVHRSQTR